MLAVVKGSRSKRIILSIQGEIPSWIINRLKKEYKNRLMLNNGGDVEEKEELMFILESGWDSSIDLQKMPGENLRNLRVKAGLSQSTLGKKIGNIPRQNVSAMEMGKRGISKETAKKLSKVFNVPVSRFI